MCQLRWQEDGAIGTRYTPSVEVVDAVTLENHVANLRN